MELETLPTTVGSTRAKALSRTHVSGAGRACFVREVEYLAAHPAKSASGESVEISRGITFTVKFTLHAPSANFRAATGLATAVPFLAKQVYPLPWSMKTMELQSVGIRSLRNKDL
jgi:hypothetical protein